MTRQSKTATALLILGVVFPCIRVVQGGYRDTLQKAARACPKCIGIG